MNDGKHPAEPDVVAVHGDVQRAYRDIRTRFFTDVRGNASGERYTAPLNSEQNQLIPPSLEFGDDFIADFLEG